MSTDTKRAEAAQDAAPNKPGRRFRIRASLPADSPERIARRARRIRLERAALIVSKTYTDCTTACRSVGLRDIDALRDLCDARGIPRKHRWGAPPPPQDRKATYRRVNSWRLNNSGRQKALSAVAIAIANYDLTRGPCERCGTDKNVCADPFSLKPLRVHWRCRSSSAELRRQRNLVVQAEESA